MIVDEMHVMRRTIAVSMNSDKMIKMVVDQLEKNGKMKTNNTTENKRKIGARVLVDNFMIKDMMYQKEDWDDVEIEEINSGIKKDKNGKKQ